MGKKPGRRLGRPHLKAKKKGVNDSRLPSVSACMMVKNEEGRLSRCLNSIKDSIDELIVVDTGSSDKTVEIAESFGAKVYHHPWEGDFSKHRNQSIGYATKDWIFIVDADEELEIKTGGSEALKQSLSRVPKDYSAAAIVVNDWQSGKLIMEWTSARFFRRGTIRYEGIVHNQPVLKGGSVFFPPLVINHYGYNMTAEEKKKKFERTGSLLHKVLEKDPKDYNTLFYLCQLYANNNFSKEAVEYAEKYIVHKDELKGTSNFNPSIYFTAFGNYMRLQNREKAYEWLVAGEEEISEDIDMAFARIEFGVWTENPDIILEGSERYVKLFEKFERDVTMRQNRFIYTHRIEPLLYATYCLCSKHIEKGAKALALFNNLVPKVPEKIASTLLAQLKEDLEKLPIPIQVNLATQGATNQVMSQGAPAPVDLSKITLQGGNKRWE